MAAGAPRAVPALTGLILAGGRSARMGVDKAMLEFEGEPLVVRAVRRMSAACDEVIVASGDGARLSSVVTVRQVADARPEAGPLGGLVAGLEAATNDLVAAVAVDMPFASPELFVLLAGDRDGEDAVVPMVSGEPEPLHAVYARDAVPALHRCLAAGRFGLRRALLELRVLRVDAERWRAADPSGAFAWNVNRPEDLSSVSPPAAGRAGRLRHDRPSRG